MDWREQSELNFGLLLKGELPQSLYRADIFHLPYDAGFEVLASNGDKAAIVQAIGIPAWQAATQAAQTLNGASKDIDWAGMLEQEYYKYTAGDRLETIGRKMKRGDDVNYGDVADIIARGQTGNLDAFTPITDIAADTAMFLKSGIPAIDLHLGGWPIVGLIVVAGRPKVGKTSLMLKFAEGFVKAHDKKTVAVFTLEMLKTQLRKRFDEISSDIADENLKRILVCDQLVSADQVISWSAGVKDLGCVIVDFADFLIQGEISESVMTWTYKCLAQGAKKLGVPLILLAQLSGNYEGGVPRPHHVRYSRLIEALAVLELMLYQKGSDYFAEKDQDVLQHVGEDQGCIFAWLARFGTPHTDFPGYIVLPFSGRRGWDLSDAGTWFTKESLRFG